MQRLRFRLILFILITSLSIALKAQDFSSKNEDSTHLEFSGPKKGTNISIHTDSKYSYNFNDLEFQDVRMLNCDPPVYFQFYQCKMDSLAILPWCQNGTIASEVQIGASFFKELFIAGADTLNVHENEIESFLGRGFYGEFSLWRNSKLNKLLLSESYFNGEVTIWENALPDTIDFSNTSADSLVVIDLTQFIINNDKVCRINLFNAPLKQIKFRYTKNFQLYFPPDSLYSFEDRISFYDNLLSLFKKDAFTDSYEHLEKDYFEFRYVGKGSFRGHVANFIDKHWWDYGYNKFLVVRNALIFNVLFAIINFFIYDLMLRQGYSLKGFVEISNQIDRATLDSPILRRLRKAPYVFLYSSYIFWGWKLDLEKLNVGKIGLFSWVLFQYLVGIVFLAYLANLVITV